MLGEDSTSDEHEPKHLKMHVNIPVKDNLAHNVWWALERRSQ